jgi:threonine/homoserine/homoserine lactone efflux protein
MNKPFGFRIMRSLIALYVPFACLMFCVFLGGFLTDDSTSKSDLISWMAVFVGAALFPIVLPIALTERLLKAKLPKPDRRLTSQYQTRPRTSG